MLHHKEHDVRSQINELINHLNKYSVIQHGLSINPIELSLDQSHSSNRQFHTKQNIRVQFLSHKQNSVQQLENGGLEDAPKKTPPTSLTGKHRNKHSK
jgi:hypothetical protein